MNVSAHDFFHRCPDYRQTNDSTKEIGTADFSNILPGIREEIAQSCQIDDSKNFRSFLYDNSASITDRVCDTLKEIESGNESVVNSTFCGDYVKAQKQKKHRREISVTDVMPKAELRKVQKLPSKFSVPHDKVMSFLEFCKRFRKTMRSLIFIQYFTVGELIKLKLVHPNLNEIIDSSVISSSIQMGNLSPEDRCAYWKSKVYTNVEGISKILPAGMVKLIKNSDDMLLTSIRSTLLTNLPEVIDHNEEVMNKMIASLFIENHLYRIYEDHTSSDPFSNTITIKPSQYCTNIEMMVFTLESLINTHLGVKIKDSNNILRECFSTLLTNLIPNNEFSMIKILECFSSGGWKRIYSILLNLISHMMEENGSFSFQKLLDDIREFAQYRDLLKISFPEVQNSSPVVVSSEEIESLENQYMLAYMIKKTEKIHKEIKEKAIKKRKNNISIKRFFIRKPKDIAEGNKLNLKLADKSHFRDLAEKELYKDLLNLYHTEHLKLEKDVEIINCKLLSVKGNIKKL
ncbi:unnamed protein product [Moneuplotes crassus]|uniref:Uncharacterized protein n=1 Tax=Euplotes crassus TaxID=5936 RepID=A0AAD2D9K7_EUPCR|nr:unnamed protein product [Moneuplotes crassus]